MMNIDQFSPHSGRTIREDGSVVNAGDMMSRTPIEIARGNMPGAMHFPSFGDLLTSGAVTDHLVWPLSGGALAVPDAAGVQMAIVSDSADDTAAGTGIRSIEIIYLDSALALQSETVTLNGTTPVNTLATDIRFIECMHLVTAGAGGKAAGNISATNSATVYSYIASGKRRCSSSARRVPAGKRLIIDSISVSSLSGAGQARAQFYLVTTKLYETDLTESAITFPHIALGAQDNSNSARTRIVVDAGVAVGFEVTCDKASTLSAEFNGWIENI